MDLNFEIKTIAAATRHIEKEEKKGEWGGKKSVYIGSVNVNSFFFSKVQSDNPTFRAIKMKRTPGTFYGLMEHKFYAHY